MIVRLFGPLEVEAGGRVLRHSEFGGAKARQVLEVVAIRRGRVVAKPELAEALWPDVAPAAVEAAIETHVSRLRRALGEPGVVVTASRGYQLGPVDVDLDLFDRLLAEGTLASLSRAVALARAEVGQHDPGAGWFQEARRRYGAALTEALSRAARLAIEGGEYPLAVAYSRRALGRDLEREVDFQTLIAASYLGGNRPASLRAFEACRRILRARLGTEPGPATGALHRSVLRGLPLEPAAGGGDPGPRALCVESDRRLQGRLIQACGEAGYTSELVLDLPAAFARMRAHRYQLIVLSEALARVGDVAPHAGGTEVVAAGDVLGSPAAPVPVAKMPPLPDAGRVGGPVV